MTLALEVRRLSERDLTGSFDCGPGADGEILKLFFERFAKKHQRAGGSVTHVACCAGEIVGYVTIGGSIIDPKEIPEHAKGLGAYHRPVLLLARMATAVRFRGKGVGDRLMHDVVFAEALRMVDGSGCLGVLVDAKPGAITFYQRHGFQTLHAGETTTRMFLPLKEVRARAGSSAAAAASAIEKSRSLPGPAPASAVATFPPADRVSELGAREE